MRGMGTNHRLPNWLLGLLLLGVIAVGSVLAYTKKLPWGDRYEVHAVFSSAQTIRSSSPVRIAGVNVGEVTEVELTEEPFEDEAGDLRPAVRVTMELDENALPLKEDAFFKVRPRLFIDGNYFVDLNPGSPSAPEVSDGYTFGIERTAHSVQLDQVLATLQSDVRSDLRTLLDQLGNALVYHRGAEGLRELYPHLAAGLQVHRPGLRVAARHAPWRPARRDQRPRPRLPRPGPEPGGAQRSGHQPAPGDRRLRGGGAWRSDRRSSACPASSPKGSRRSRP